MKYLKLIKLLIIKIEKCFFERNKSGVKYIFRRNGSDKLLIVFSGIGGDYNYRRSLKHSSWDQLFIKDDWAKGVSYYLFENGCNRPEQLTSNFIRNFLLKRKYEKIVTLGSSKGGSAALYFGLKHQVDEIFAGACQYRIGDYLGIYHEDKNSGYYSNVMGGVNKEMGITELNAKMETMLDSRKNTPTLINLIYSKNEHTYEDHIVHLIKKLDDCNIRHIDQVESFTEHSMIGDFMKVICQKIFK